MPILVLGHLILGATLVWSYINQQERFLSPAVGAPGQWCNKQRAEEIPQKFPAQNCTLYEVLCLNL